MQTAELLPPDSCKVYTPRPIADAMVQALGTDRSSTWLEPCVGRGVFLSALKDAGVSPERITAVDLDPFGWEHDSLARTYRGVDFLSWSHPPLSLFDRIVGNPPYVPLSRLDARLRDTAAVVRIPGGDLTVQPSSNLWFAFLCRCLELLKPKGNLALVLPAAWDFADYAGTLRQGIPQLFREFTTFRSRRPLFDEVQDGSVIIIGRGYQSEHQHNRRVECRDRDELVARIRASCVSVGHVSSAPLAERSEPSAGVQLGNYLEIRLGGVTGHAEYFLLTEAQRLALRLPKNAVKPVLSRSRHLTGALIGWDSWRALLLKGERVWLFDPTEGICSHPAVIDYLSLSSESGGCDRGRYKIRIRKPWYRTPLPARVDGFMSGMTRTGPWLALRSMRSLNATNTLYVARFKESATLASKSALALAMLTSDVRDELREKCRHYADGLMKHEPGDLTSIRVPPLRNYHDATAAYTKAVKSLLVGKDKDASAIADAFFAR
jgi:adenine-specific DNA-methyltransferase